MRVRNITLGIVGLTAISITLVWAGSPFFVAQRAEKIAGDRPYCILVSNHDESSNNIYETASKLSQLSFYNLTARLEHTWGSRGFYYQTNYALLVLDQPREYLNWTFYGLDFAHEALINVHHWTINGKQMDVMEFKPCTPETDFVGSLK